METFRPCASCGSPVRAGTCSCPFCGEKACSSTAAPSRAAVLLGLALTACSGPGPVQMDYGVMETGDPPVDADGDGYTDDVDCDDSDNTIHPEAAETPGDGVDSNCNDDDDT